MAVSKEKKQLFNSKISPYKAQLDDIKKESSMLKSVGRKSKQIEPYVNFRLATLGLQRIHTLLMMNELSQKIQELKNDTYLNDARKEVSAHLSELLKIVGDDTDGSLTENKEKLPKIAKVTPTQKLNLLTGLKEATEMVKEAMGDRSKWRWSFPDLHFKIAILARNMFDFVEYGKIKDPSEEFYHKRQEYVRFLTEESQTAAQEYRSKYELSTKDVGDLQTIERIFEMMRKIHQATGNTQELDQVKVSLDAIKAKIEDLMAEKKGKAKKKK